MIGFSYTVSAPNWLVAVIVLVFATLFVATWWRA